MSLKIENSDKNKGLSDALKELGLFVSEVQVPKGDIPYIMVSRYDLSKDGPRTIDP